MFAKVIRIGLCFALTLGFSAIWEVDCRAASIYTVTDLGSGFEADTFARQREAEALHPMLGLNLTDAESAALPWVHGVPVGTSGGSASFQMLPYQNTESGIVLGVVPQGYDRGMPWGNKLYVTTQKQADGSFSPFENLAVQFGPYGDSLENSFASLDARGNLLLTNRHVQQLIDMNTGARIDLATLLPPGTLDRPGFSGTITMSKMAADGTIFAQIKSDDFANGSDTHLFLMTPVPEPSTLATFAVLVAGLGVARGRSKRRDASSSISTE